MKYFLNFIKPLVLLVICSIPSFIQAQTSIKESELPKSVKTRFIKKFKEKPKAVWSKADTSYIATFKLDKRLVKCYISPQGYWQKNIIYLENTETPVGVANYLKKNFTGNPYNIYKWEIVNSEMMYFVQIYDIASKQLSNNVYFNKTGKFIRSEEVEIIEKTETPEEIVKKDVKNMDDLILNDTLDILYNEELNEKPIKINIKELPSPIIDYLAKNFKEEKVVKSLLFNNKHTSYYLLEVKKEGQKVSTKLKFDLKGNFIDFQE